MDFNPVDYDTQETKEQARRAIAKIALSNAGPITDYGASGRLSAFAEFRLKLVYTREQYEIELTESSTPVPNDWWQNEDVKKDMEDNYVYAMEGYVGKTGYGWVKVEGVQRLFKNVICTKASDPIWGDDVFGDIYEIRPSYNKKARKKSAYWTWPEFAVIGAYHLERIAKLGGNPERYNEKGIRYPMYLASWMPSAYIRLWGNHPGNWGLYKHIKITEGTSTRYSLNTYMLIAKEGEIR